MSHGVYNKFIHLFHDHETSASSELYLTSYLVWSFRLSSPSNVHRQLWPGGPRKVTASMASGVFRRLKKAWQVLRTGDSASDTYITFSGLLGKLEEYSCPLISSDTI